MTLAPKIAALFGVAALGAAAVLAAKRRGGGGLSSPFGTLSNRTNVTDELNPAPPDVNDPAPPGSLIIGETTGPRREDSAEEHRLMNLQRRWRALQRKGFIDARTSPPDVLAAFEAWRTFGTRRNLRSMAGWEAQFRALARAEDWAASRGFRPDRSDSSDMTDAEYEAHQ